MLSSVYQKTGETPISLTILEARCRLFGHILRQAINTTHKAAMTKYFKTAGSKQRGRPKTSIVTTLRRDLKSHNNYHWPTRLHSMNDLDHLCDIAQNRSNSNIQISPGRDVSRRRSGQALETFSTRTVSQYAYVKIGKAD
ncbi:hypothetical protein ElyMa_006419500 [Elysia marginata]|uniref:Uncharacterized protein n=1 Tax=Elysia marginata TaxID=1093978 RepID=A0AAV4HUB2_9GAST|nr:hypothetical protein ElyMa_006419500 [Elysia marginata]